LVFFPDKNNNINTIAKGIFNSANNSITIIQKVCNFATESIQQDMKTKSPIERIRLLVLGHKKEVVSIYLFSILSGVVNLSLPLGVQTIIGLVMGATMVTSIYVLIFFVVLGVFFVGLFQINQMRIIESIQQRLFASYAFDFAEKLPKLDLKYIDHYFMPEKVTRFFDVVSIQKGFAKLLLDIPIASVQIILGILLLSLYHPLFIVLGFVLLVGLGLVLFYTSKKGIETSIEESNYKYAVAGFFSEIARTLKSFKFNQGSTLHTDKTDHSVSGYLQARTQHFRVLLLQYKTLIVFKVSLTILMLTLGTYLLINQVLNIGEFIAAEIVILMVISAVEKLIVSLDSAYDVMTGLEKLASVTECPEERSGKMALEAPTGIEILMQDFSYSFITNKPAIQSINLHIKAGEKISILGPSGSGKSLLLRMITGNYPDFEGMLLINKVPIQNYELKSLRQKTGVLLPGQEIFGGTVWENISLGQQNISPTHILARATELGFEDFISHFPLGFDNILEPIGKKTPQTLIRKILLLRALCGEKSLLLLEEPWTGLPEDIAQKVRQYLLTLSPKTTVVVVTNHPDFISKTDQQISLSHGKI
jgi:ABC-type bacteriocin/lantibiotic exporter with double-glycine peptidase domain